MQVSYSVDGTIDNQKAICYGTVTVSVVNGEYHFVFENIGLNADNIYLPYAEFTGDIANITIPDTRTKLAAPTVNATADGKVINISWNEIVGADQYYIFCYVGGLEAITTNETSVSIEAAYGTNYEFLIRAEALDSNPDYKSSEDTYFSVKTANDPNSFAQYMATDLKWDSAGYFVFTVSQYEIFRVKMNDADCPNHTTIKAGDYTGVASSTVSTGQFSVYQKVVGGYTEGWSSTKTTSTMSVSYVDGEYVIIVNYVSAWGGSGEVGYKGVPTGWDIPGASGGDDSGDGDDTGDGGDTGGGDDTGLGSAANPYTFSTFVKGEWTLEFSDAENGDRIVMDCNTLNVDAWISDHGANTWIALTKLLYGSGASIYGCNGTDYTNAQFWGNSFVKVSKSGSTYTFVFNLKASGGTSTYYKYVGEI